MDAIQKFIIVDDDSINNLLCSIILEDQFPTADIKAFTDPEEALNYIKFNYSDLDGIRRDTILFLDINMPLLDGWQFLEAFDLFDDSVKKSIEIYLLSSSIDNKDIKRAEENSYVSSFLGKPLTEETVIRLANK